MALIQIYAICPLVKLALDSTGKKSYAHNKGSPNVNKSVAHETTDRCVDYSYNTIKPNLSNLFFRVFAFYTVANSFSRSAGIQ